MVRYVHRPMVKVSLLLDNRTQTWTPSILLSLVFDSFYITPVNNSKKKALKQNLSGDINRMKTLLRHYKNLTRA